MTQSLDPNYQRLHAYWTVGEGGQAKIRWGAPGDWTRCVLHLSKYVSPGQAKRMCQNYHHEMTGMYTGDRRNL